MFKKKAEEKYFQIFLLNCCTGTIGTRKKLLWKVVNLEMIKVSLLLKIKFTKLYDYSA